MLFVNKSAGRKSSHFRGFFDLTIKILFKVYKNMKKVHFVHTLLTFICYNTSVFPASVLESSSSDPFDFRFPPADKRKGSSWRTIMVLDQIAVKHRSFGDGIVSHSDGKYFTVKFATVEKTFVYPDIFEKFLTLADGTVPDEILADIVLSKANKQRILDAKTEENRHAMEHGIVIPGKDIVPEAKDDDGSHSEQEET